MSSPARRREVDRPIVYAVAVIVAGFLPIYVLSGPSGALFKPMADTTIYALIGSLLVTLTVFRSCALWSCATACTSGATRHSNGFAHYYAALRLVSRASVD